MRYLPNNRAAFLRHRKILHRVSGDYSYKYNIESPVQPLQHASATEMSKQRLHLYLVCILHTVDIFVLMDRWGRQRKWRRTLATQGEAMKKLWPNTFSCIIRILWLPPVLGIQLLACIKWYDTRKDQDYESISFQTQRLDRYPTRSKNNPSRQRKPQDRSSKLKSKLLETLSLVPAIVLQREKTNV
jgi:hypothetical protein